MRAEVTEKHSWFRVKNRGARFTSTASKTKRDAEDGSEVRTTQTRCERSDQGCEQRKCVAITPNRVAMNAFAMRKTRKSLPKTKNEARETEKSHRTTQNDFARGFSDSFPTQMRCKRCKRTANGLVAVQNDANGPQTDSSQLKTMQTDCKRTHRSSKRHNMACNPATQSPRGAAHR